MSPSRLWLALACAAACGKGGDTSGAKGSGAPPTGSAASGSAHGAVGAGSATTGSAEVGAAVGSAGGAAAGSAGGAGGGLASLAQALGSGSTTGAPSLAQLLAKEQAAIETDNLAAIAPLLEPDAFGIGADADEVGLGRARLVDQLRRDLGARSGPIDLAPRTWTGSVPHGAWIAEIVQLPGGRSLATTQLATETHGVWTIAAWQWARPVDNMVAFRLSQEGKLPAPAGIPDGSSGVPELDQAFKDAVGSSKGYVAAVSDRDDAFAFGSAPGEIMPGGVKIQRAFAAMKATFSVTSAMRVARASDDLGWGAANVDFTNKAGTETFRVFAIFSREGTAWKLVEAQWSNGGPLP